MAAAFWTISTEMRLVSTTAPRAAGNVRCGDRSRELVERVVASDVLAHDHVSLARHKESRRMGCPRFPVELLRRRQRFDRCTNLPGCQEYLAYDGIADPFGFPQTFNAAQSAPGRPDKMPPSLFQSTAAVGTQPHSQFDAVGVRDDIQLVDLINATHDTLGQAEADRQIGQVGGARHENGEGRAVVHKGDRTLLCHDTFVTCTI
jgi:hypothetical protein